MILEEDSIKLANETGATVAVAAYALYKFKDYNKAKDSLLHYRKIDTYDYNKSDSD